MAAPSTPVENGSADTCFHCGLLLTPHFKETFQVLGSERAFCCPGCLAVCRAIVGAGLDDYYAHRREKAVTADAILDRLLHNAHRLPLQGESMRKKSNNA